MALDKDSLARLKAADEKYAAEQAAKQNAVVGSNTASQNKISQQAAQQSTANGITIPQTSNASSVTGIDYQQRLRELGGGSYTPSAAVQSANQYLQSILNSRPGAYQSNYTQQLNDLYNQIMNREDFSYDINGDALYQQYKDQFTLQGQNAMRDTMGQAAAMTGGYGSSYASTAGNQAYQSYLQQLNEVVPELYAQAYQRYLQEGQDLKDKYSITQSADATDYGRYRDKVGDWQADRSYAQGAYESERSFDYNDYTNRLNTALAILGIEQSDAQTAAQFAQQEKMLGLEQSYQDRVRNEGYAREDSLLADERAYNEQLLAAQREYEDAVRKEGYAREDSLIASDREYNDQLRADEREYDRYLTQDQRDYEAGQLAAQRDYEAALRNEAYTREDQQNMQQQAYNMAMSMITSGAMPTSDLLAIAGVGEADALAMAKKYGYKEKSSSSGGSSSSSSSKNSGSSSGSTVFDKVNSNLSTNVGSSSNNNYNNILNFATGSSGSSGSSSAGSTISSVISDAVNWLKKYAK